MSFFFFFYPRLYVPWALRQSELLRVSGTRRYLKDGGFLPFSELSNDYQAPLCSGERKQLCPICPLLQDRVAVLSYPGQPLSQHFQRPHISGNWCSCSLRVPWVFQRAMEPPVFTPITLPSPESNSQHHTCFGLTSRVTHYSLVHRRDHYGKGWRPQGWGLSSGNQVHSISTVNITLLRLPHHFPGRGKKCNFSEIVKGIVSFKAVWETGNYLSLESKDLDLISSSKHFINVKVHMSLWVISVILLLNKTDSRPGS